MKKGQVTVLIILAIVIALALAIFFTFRTISDKENLGREYFEQQGLQPTINNIESFIIECLELTSKEAVIQIGIQGGYHNKPGDYFDMQWAFIPYYYNQGTIIQPTKQEIESELSSYVDTELETCVNKINFQDFKLKFQPPATQTKISPGEAKFTTNFPVTIEHEGNTVDFELNSHPVPINSSLEEIIEVATFITESHRTDPDLMCINCITELAKEKQLFVDFIAFESDTTLVMILENRTMEEPYIFEFLNKYNTEAITI